MTDRRHTFSLGELRVWARELTHRNTHNQRVIDAYLDELELLAEKKAQQRRDQADG